MFDVGSPAPFLPIHDRYVVAADNITEADKLIALFDAKLTVLAGSPYLGKERAEIAPNLRGFPVGKCLIFYRRLPDGIELIRVFHGARDIKPDAF